jgi:PAS domain S-box-containing protein
VATILIINDRPANRDYLVTLVGYGGHRLLQAGDGAEGLGIARAEHPDLVIADLLMPTMDGYEFVRQLRADQALANTPVIFYTAHYHEREARTLADACGVAHVLTKPCEPEVVLRTVKDALGMAPPPPAARAPEEFDREHWRRLTDKLSQKAEELKRANERLTALVDLGLDLGSERDPQRLLQSFCHRAREIVGARYALVGILDKDGGQLRHCFTSGMGPETAAPLASLDPRQGILGAVLNEGRCARRPNPGSSPGGLGLSPSFPPFRSFLGAPLLSPAGAYGWLCLLDKIEGEEFSADDERVAGVLAAKVGRIYENGSLYAEVLRHSAELELEVSERQRAEAALRESEEKLRGAFEYTNVATVLTDIDNRFLRVNAAFARLFGYSPAEMLHLSMQDVTHPDDLADSFARREALLAGGGHSFEMEKRYLHRDGHVLWGLTNVSLVRDAGGRPRFYVCQVQDITERRRAEEALRFAQQRLQHVLASSPAVLFTLGAEGEDFRPTWISENVQEMLGYPVEEVFRPGWWNEGVHPEDRARVQAEIEQGLLKSGGVVTEYRFRHREGKYHWVRTEQRLLRDAAGRPLEVVGSWSDVTERKHLEDQYRQAQKMEAVGRLAGGVAHDFNNLLTVINGYGELVMAALPAGDPTRELVKEVVQAGDRAAALTRQLLAFSRKAILAPVVLDLKELIANLEKMLLRIIGEDITLAVVTDPGLAAVKADPGQMEQVIVNLVVNARDAMPQGGHLTIEARNVYLDETYARDHPEARAGRHVLLAVSDEGCGMDAATVARIWEPFFTTKGDKGTGLGLATVYGIIKQSGGHVAAYSEVGHGTTIKVYLPRVDQRPRLGKSHQGLVVMPGGGETVLLVEDEDGVRALARHVLQQGCGYTVLEARDGKEALRMAEQHPGRIDLLVTDVVLPRMGGRMLAEGLAATHPEAKVLFLSGYTDDAVVRHGILEAQVAFLQKPFSPASLASKVREVLDSEAD